MARQRDDRTDRILKLAQVLNLLQNPAQQEAQLNQQSQNQRMQTALAVMGMSQSRRQAGEERAARASESEAGRKHTSMEAALTRALQQSMHGDSVALDKDRVEAQKDQFRQTMAEAIAGRTDKNAQFDKSFNFEGEKFHELSWQERQKLKNATEALALNRELGRADVEYKDRDLALRRKLGIGQLNNAREANIYQLGGYQKDNPKFDWNKFLAGTDTEMAGPAQETLDKALRITTDLESDKLRGAPDKKTYDLLKREMDPDVRDNLPFDIRNKKFGDEAGMDYLPSNWAPAHSTTPGADALKAAGVSVGDYSPTKAPQSAFERFGGMGGAVGASAAPQPAGPIDKRTLQEILFGSVLDKNNSSVFGGRVQ